MLPFTYVLATFGNRLFAEIALLVPLFWLVNVGIAYRLNQVFYSGYRLRHAYGRLTEDYTALNRKLEQQLVELDEAQRQVDASGRKLALFAERAPIAVLELDNEGRIQQINHAAENLFGWTSNELVEKNASVKILIRPEFHADFDTQWQQLMASRAPVAAPEDQQRAARRAGSGVRMERDPAGQQRRRRGRRDRPGPGHHAPDGSRAAEEGIHLDPQPRAAHARSPPSSARCS